MAAYAGTFSDPDGDSVTISVASGPGSVVQDPAGGNSGSWNWSFGASDGPSQSQTVTITASDGKASSSTSFTLTVNNAAPTATLRDPNPPVLDEGSAIPVSLINPSDPGSADTAAGFSYSFSCQDVPVGTSPSWGPFGAETGRWCPTDDNGIRTVRGRIQDKDGGMSSYGRSVTIQNVAPTATFNKPLAVDEGSPINLSLSAVREPSFKDQQAGLQMAFKCGIPSTPNYGPFGSSYGRSCTPSDNGTVPVGAKIMDKDNGFTEYPLDNPGNGSVTVNNVAPKADLNVPQSVNQRQAFTVLFTNQFDPSSADTAAGFTYAFDCGSGYGPEVADSVASCVAGMGPSQTIRGKIIDKDGGITERTRTVTINDVTSPRVKSTAPKGGDVSARAKPTVTFSEAMNKASVEASKNGKPTTFFLKTGRTTIAATVKYVETATGQYKAIMTPTSPLRSGVTYTATVTSAAKDLAGNPLVSKSWQFAVN